MSWRDWIGHGIELQFNPRLAVGDEAESWLAGWAEKSRADRRNSVAI